MRVKILRLTTRALGMTTAAATAVTIAGLHLTPALAAPTQVISVPCNTSALVEAVATAPSGSTLLLAPGCTYVLDQALPTISKTLFITGPATLQRSYAEDTPDFTIMTIAAGGVIRQAMTTSGHVVLNHVSFVNGDSREDGVNGGAIYNKRGAYLAIDGGTFSHDFASHEGGAILNCGTLHVKGANFTHDGAQFGGAIANEYTASVISSSFSHNRASDGGGIYVHGPTSVDLSSFTGDNNAEYGGATYVSSATLTLTNSQINDNDAKYGGASYNWRGQLNVAGDTFDSNGGSGDHQGGAIYNLHHMSLAGSTFAGNQATYGGAVYNTDIATMSFDKIETNTAATDGGGIYNVYELSISDTNLHNNHAGHDGAGIYNEEFLTITGSELAHNLAGTAGGGIYNEDSTTISTTSVDENTPDNCAPPGSVAGCIG